jgi:hypothetical protein
MSNSKHILIGTSTYGKHIRQDLCVESLIKLSKTYDNVDVCLVQQESDDLVYSNIENIKELTRNSSDVLDTNKNMPFINDIFNILSKKATDVFVFCNSDIILTQQLIEYIDKTETEAFGISRIDISQINALTEPANIIRMEPAGFDCWVVSKNWWTEHSYLFKDFVIGRPFFDVMYTITMLLNSKNQYISNKHLIYHINHPRQWSDHDECYVFNKTQKESFYENLETIWGECCNNTFLKRSDWGSFLQFLPTEETTIKQIQAKYLQ